MNNQKLYICVSCGSPEFYLTFYGEETSDIRQAAKCTSRGCAKLIIEEYKNNSENQNGLLFVVEEYNED